MARVALGLAGSFAIGVVPAGERWPDGGLRPAIEDLIGAGAILDRLGVACSPEARIARDASRRAGTELGALIRGSVSGRELSERGFAGDVDIAVQQEVSSAVPILRDGAYQNAAAG